MSLESELIELKIAELLKDVELTNREYESIDKAVSSIVDAIASIPDQEVDVGSASGFVRDLHVAPDKLGFAFRTPVGVHVAGSHAIRAVVKPEVSADILVQMPKECFHEKDYLNHRYHAKRCLYLCTIEKNLKSNPLIRKIEWSTFWGEARKPILTVYPAVELPELSGLFIRIIPSAKDVFNISKLNLMRNNVREFTKGGVTSPTLMYNSSILEDIFLEENSEFITKSLNCKDSKNLMQALILLKVWLRQRNSINTPDCMNGYLISVVVAFLASESGPSIINTSMTARQIFRITLKFIANSSVWEKGFFLKPARESNLSKEEINQYMQDFPVAMCDASGHFNLMFRITNSAILELRDEAGRTLNWMEKCRDGGFDEIFMTKVDFSSKFDSCLRLNLRGKARVCNSGLFCLDEEYWRVYEKNVYSILTQGLTDRVNLVRVIWSSAPSNWNILEGFSEFGSEPMCVGILVNSHEKSSRVVDIGPSPENKEEAIKFRKFWGEKSELRRFKDGAIAESTVWECEMWERHLIIKRISEYVLSRHFQLLNEDIFHTADQLDFCLCVNGKDPVSLSGNLLGAFEKLSKRLRNLEDIPLKITTVQPLDPAFRHTSVFPPLPNSLAREKISLKSSAYLTPSCIHSLDVMIQLEGSGNWPLDPVAVEKTKSAFLLKIGESLEERYGMFCTASEGEVNVHTSGYSFSLKIFHERGLNVSPNQALTNAKNIDKELYITSQHSSMINGLNGRFPTYGPVVRLAKRWVSSHLFSSYFTEEAIESVVAYLFLKPYPFHPPLSRISGFLRFLRLISNYDWAFSPLLVDINNDFSTEDEKEIYDDFMSSRKSFEGNSNDLDSAMFIATSYDKKSEAWTMHSPSKQVLKRMGSYARSSAELLTGLIFNGGPSLYSWECLFKTPMSKYDAVIILHKERLSHPYHLLSPSEIPNGELVIWGKPSKDFHPYITLDGALRSIQDARDKLMVNFDPTRYILRDLQRAFPDTFKVWYDSTGGDAIGLTWDKNLSKKRKRGEGGGDEERERVDPVEILREVGEIGKGFVKGVYLLKAPRL